MDAVTEVRVAPKMPEPMQSTGSAGSLAQVPRHAGVLMANPSPSFKLQSAIAVPNVHYARSMKTNAHPGAQNQTLHDHQTCVDVCGAEHASERASNLGC